MANNVSALDAAAATVVFSTNDIGGVHYAKNKMVFGADATATDVSLTNGLPVQPATSATWVLGAGTAAFGRLAANDGVDVGDVTVNNSTGASAVNVQDGGNSLTVDGGVNIVTSMVPGTGTSHLGKAEDAAAGDGDTGVVFLAVRQDTATNSVSATGDYATLQVDANGKLHVNPGFAAGTAGTSATTVMTIQGISGGITVPITHAALTSIASDYVANSALSTKVTSLPSVTIQQGILGPQKAEDDASANADAGMGCLAVRKASPANTSGSDGDYEFLQISAGRLWASATIDAALPAGSNAIGTVTGVGSVAHDGVDSGNPVKVGGRARSTDVAQVSTDDRTDFITDLAGKQVVLPYAIPQNLVKGTTAAIVDTTSTSVIAAGAAGIRNYITSVLVTNSHATVSTFVKILDGSTIIWEGYALAAGGGFSCSFPAPLQGTAATAINAQCVTTGANVIVSAAGFTGA